MKNLFIGFSATAIIVIAGIISVVWVYKPVDIGIELLKSLLQILVAIVLGQVAALVVANFNYQRQRLEAIRDFRAAVLEKLNRAYSEAKKIRRLIRARSPDFQETEKPEDVTIAYALYDGYLQELNAVQLALETLGKEVVASSVAFSQPKAIEKSLRAMEAYLNKILHEFQFKRPQINQAGLFRLGDLPELCDLLGSYQGSRFRQEFVHTYDAALKCLQEDVLEARKAA